MEPFPDPFLRDPIEHKRSDEVFDSVGKFVQFYLSNGMPKAVFVVCSIYPRIQSECSFWAPNMSTGIFWTPLEIATGIFEARTC